MVGGKREGAEAAVSEPSRGKKRIQRPKESQNQGRGALLSFVMLGGSFLSHRNRSPPFCVCLFSFVGILPAAHQTVRAIYTHFGRQTADGLAVAQGTFEESARADLQRLAADLDDTSRSLKAAEAAAAARSEDAAAAIAQCKESILLLKGHFDEAMDDCRTRLERIDEELRVVPTAANLDNKVRDDFSYFFFFVQCVHACMCCMCCFVSSRGRRG